MKTYLLITAILTAFLVSACGDSTTTTNSSNAAANRPANGNANGNGVLTPQTPTPEATTNNAPTLGPVYKEYCAALEKKDETALRRVHDSATTKEYEQKMKADGLRTLSEYLSDDKATSAFCEVRNEKITGDYGTAEVKTMGYPNGVTAVFAKENGEWKLTNRRPEGALK